MNTTLTTPIRAGDHVLHRPSGETWVVAAVEGDELAWAGWPDGLARTQDCERTHEAADAEHREFQRLVERGSGSRARMARRHACPACAVADAQDETTEIVGVAS
jgi:hypothetical protein